MKTKTPPEIIPDNKIVLQLYVAGMSQRSMEAIANITKLCEEYLPGAFKLEIIDIYKNPAVASEQQIIFSPSLVKLLPLPQKTFIGTFSDTPKMIKGLGISLK